ncbi:MAG: hypothetical protein NTY23_07880 [Chloroflexi bacterium]|jgi:hypothetical protein|nr:hypothetical protein [Chloroflexota bacterium]
MDSTAPVNSVSPPTVRSLLEEMSIVEPDNAARASRSMRAAALAGIPLQAANASPLRTKSETTSGLSVEPVFIRLLL